MALKVEVYEKEKVRPSSPTPQTLRYHKLSLLDVLAGPFYGSHVFFYPSGAGPRRHDYDELKESLSKTLSILYPLAGRLKDGSIIECNDEGADFVRANVTNYDLGEFLRHPKLEDLRQLLPLDPYPDAINPAMPMSAVQVNRFRCGGTAVGFCTWHGIVDGIGMANLYNTMAAINRGERVAGGGLVVDVAAIFSPGNSKIFQVMSTAMAGLKNKLGKYASKRYIFSKQDIERIRNQYSQSEHRRRPSRVAVLSAFVWAAVIRATLVANPTLKTHLLTHYVNLRNKLNPPLPSQCLGNILHGTDSVWEVDGSGGAGAGEQVAGRSLVGRVVEAIDKVTTDYVREMHTEGAFLRSILARRSKIIDHNKDETKVLSISSLCKIPIFEVDFGWGKPIWNGLPQTLLDLVLFVDTDDGGIEVWIGLEHEVMCNLDKDAEFRAFVSFAYIVSESSCRLNSAL
ncbi:stemmadenine O-acetyltransferase-like [Ipomoea triloba]|uniref:stemmadenine O-acetyltransferase-like n=1 Tax=Ipomoea triloba TaxID=35885 RepID=UPI00125D66AB|nr:stemmadenine O-acetyltransferase-like [Ipomoea triloba]